MRWTSVALPVALVVAGAVFPAGAGGRDPMPSDANTARWRVLGPGGGGTTRRPTVSPHDVGRVLVACDMTGAYLTEDGGASWGMFNLGADVSSFAFDPSNPRVLYAGTMALWRSDDAGRTWTMVFPDPSRETRTLMVGDHGDAVLRTNDPLYPPAGGRMRVQAIAVASDGTVAIALSGSAVFRGSDDPGAVYVSRDARDWTRVRALPSEQVLAMAVSADKRLALVTSGHVLVQRATGWDDRDSPPSGPMHAASVTFARDGSVPVLAATGAGQSDGHGDQLFRSSDGGRTWSGLAPPPGGLAPSGWSFRALTASPIRPEIAYVGFEPRGRDHSASGIARTADGGRTWRTVLREGPAPSPAMEGSWVEERASNPGPDIWFDAPYDMAVSPTDPDVVYVTDLFRTYRTLDGGAHWRQLHSRRVGLRAWTTTGLDVTTNYGLDADPFDHRRLFLTNTDIGLFRSEDGGRSWIPSSEGMPQDWRNTTYAVAFDPAVRGLAWAAFSGTHDLPRPKMWRRRDPASFRGGIGISRDGGRSWTPARGLPSGAATHVLVDPASPAGGRTVYATLFGRGVFKSNDGGISWAAANRGLPGPQPFAWRLVPAPNDTLYLIVARRSEDGRIGDEQDGGLFVSEDGADHWRPVRLPDGSNGPSGLLVDPDDPSRLYLALWGRAAPDGDTGGGVFLSTDRGASWRPVFTEAQHVYDVTIDRRTRVLYACGFDQGAWRSTDDGATWQRIPGFTFKWGHRVIPDPATADRIYITTFGGGLWSGPAR